MELERNGAKIEINFGQLSDAELAAATSEIAEANALRRVDVSVPAGSVAVEGAVDAVAMPEAIPTPVTPESLFERVDTAHKGYTDFVTQLNARREAQGTKGKESLRVATAEKLAKELEVWATKERVEYVNKVLEADPNLTYTVTATPNDRVSGQEVRESGVQFGDNQPYKTDVWSDILTEYTDEEVSGTNVRNDNAYMISVRFSKPTLTSGDRATQNRAIAKMQKDNPFVRPTTPLEDEVYARTLRAQAGGSLSGEGVFEATITRFPQMDPKRIGGDFQYVPGACVGGNGGRIVGASYVDDVDFVAVVVG